MGDAAVDKANEYAKGMSKRTKRSLMLFIEI